MKRYLPILMFLLCLTGSSAWAGVAYVTDSFEVTVRTGPSTENKITAMPSSGQSMQVVETQGDWSRVRLSIRDGGNIEGWILSRYLITRVPWELQAKAAKEEIASLKEKLSRVEQERNELKGRDKDLSGKVEAASAALAKLQGEYETFKKGAAEYIALKREYETARSTLESNGAAIKTLSEENRVLKSSQQHMLILAGAAILLFGLIIGLVMGRKQRKRKSLY
jgi:SH3 domain protein